MDTQRIQALVDRRDEMRRAGFYMSADAIRAKLAAQGVIVEDHYDGTTWRRSLAGSDADKAARDEWWAEIRRKVNA